MADDIPGAAADRRTRAATLPLLEVDPGAPVARAATRRYVEELQARFPGGFDPGAPDRTGTFVVALDDGEPVAYGGVRSLSTDTGEVKRMWVHPGWRGAGLGSRLLRHLEDLARRLGHTRVVLDTNGTLTEAIAMYDRAGYTRVERYNDNPYAEAFFAKTLD